MNMCGWTTWGYTTFQGNTFRVYKHHAGQIVALPESTDDPFILLSQMNEYLEDQESAKSPTKMGIVHHAETTGK